jgi:hypothetical protein
MKYYQKYVIISKTVKKVIGNLIAITKAIKKMRKN